MISSVLCAGLGLGLAVAGARLIKAQELKPNDSSFAGLFLAALIAPLLYLNG